MLCVVVFLLLRVVVLLCYVGVSALLFFVVVALCFCCGAGVVVWCFVAFVLGVAAVGAVSCCSRFGSLSLIFVLFPSLRFLVLMFFNVCMFCVFC